MRVEIGLSAGLECRVDTPSGPVIDSRCPPPRSRLQHLERCVTDRRRAAFLTQNKRRGTLQGSFFVRARPTHLTNTSI